MIARQPTLNKCSNITKPSSGITEFNTPGSLTAKSSFLETPKSAHGSSIFSPGEAFWHEAIQLADGLCNQTVNFYAKAAEDIAVAESRHHSQNSCNLRIGNCDGKLMEKGVEGKSVAALKYLGGLLGKHEKGLVEEKSPLPVKHFDFSFEDKPLDRVIGHHIDIGDLKYTAHGVGVPFEPGLMVQSPRDDNTINHFSKHEKNKEICKGGEIISAAEVAKRRENERIEYDTPIDGIRMSIGNGDSDEGSPSSIMPSRDWLDLSSWLPSEVCSVYRKKGISKLYSWQVMLNMWCGKVIFWYVALILKWFA